MATVREGEVHVGLYCGRREYVIAPPMVQEYADAVQDHNPWYFGPSPFGGPLAPEGAHQRAHLEVWCQKPDGTVTIVGSASALLP